MCNYQSHKLGRHATESVKLTSLFVAIACGEDRCVPRQQFDRQRFDPSYQRYRNPWAFDRHHPRNRRHPATVLKQPREEETRGQSGGKEEKKEMRTGLEE